MINKDYLYTKIWDDLSSVVLELNALYLYAQDPEDRSRHCSSNLSTNNIDAIFEEVSINDNDQMLVSSNNSIVPLSSADAIGSFFFFLYLSSIIFGSNRYVLSTCGSSDEVCN